jgi:large conductance mechanosensitive channel
MVSGATSVSASPEGANAFAQREKRGGGNDCAANLALPQSHRIPPNQLPHPMSVIEEFKAFVTKGNVVDLAVGVIIGGAFGKIVESMVKDVITPLIGMVGGQPDFSGIKLGSILIGNFINAVIAFLILAAVVFFVLVKPMNKLMAAMKKPEAPAAPAAPPADVVLLTEIRDLLKK